MGGSQQIQVSLGNKNSDTQKKGGAFSWKTKKMAVLSMGGGKEVKKETTAKSLDRTNGLRKNKRREKRKREKRRSKREKNKEPISNGFT